MEMFVSEKLQRIIDSSSNLRKPFRGMQACLEQLKSCWTVFRHSDLILDISAHRRDNLDICEGPLMLNHISSLRATPVSKKSSQIYLYSTIQTRQLSVLQRDSKRNTKRCLKQAVI